MITNNSINYTMEESTNRITNNLQVLQGSDYEIADGQPDIRDWEVKNANDEKIGDVDELLFDVANRKVRYIVVDLSDNDLDLEKRLVLVPIGLAELHETDDEVVLPNVTYDQLQALHSYDENDFDSDKEASVQSVFIGLAGGTGTSYTMPTNPDFYEHEHFNEGNLYKRRKNLPETDTALFPVNADLSNDISAPVSETEMLEDLRSYQPKQDENSGLQQDPRS